MQWRIYRDIEVANRFVKIFLVHSWAEHLRQHERQTKANCELEEQVYSYVEAEPESAIFECCKLANRKIRSSLRRVRHTRQSRQYGNFKIAGSKYLREELPNRHDQLDQKARA